MRASERDWKLIYRTGAVVAIVGVAALLFDIALAMVPGWEPTTAPSTAQAWFTQFSANPWLGLRNLDLLNITVSVISLPLYVALFGAHRRSRPALAMLGLLFVSVGTVLFVANNAALPMLELSRRYAEASPAETAALEGAAVALLARGAHGSFGAFAGFFLSEIGTLITALAMLLGGVFTRRTAWLGIVGAASLTVYSVAMTFVPGAERAVMALAAPGGLMMIAWNLLVARRLWQLARVAEKDSISDIGVRAETRGAAALLPR